MLSACGRTLLLVIDADEPQQQRPRRNSGRAWQAMDPAVVAKVRAEMELQTPDDVLRSYYTVKQHADPEDSAAAAATAKTGAFAAEIVFQELDNRARVAGFTAPGDQGTAPPPDVR